MLGAIAGGLLGAIAGGAGNQQNGSSSSTSSVTMRDINDLNKGRSGLEALGDSASMSQFQDLMNLVNAGPGASAMTDSLNASNDYANLLNNSMQGPTNGQISAGQTYAQKVFAPQQTMLNQQFDDQRIQASRMAAKLGRAGNDPIIANKLMQEQTRQQTMLNSQMGSYGAQYADTLMGRQLDLGQQLMNVRNGLASQAFNNRTALMTMGQQLVNSERNYRMGTATKDSSGTQSQTSGGGIGGAIGGALAGAGVGLKMGGPSWSSMFSSTPATSGPQTMSSAGISRPNTMMNDPFGTGGSGGGEGMY